MAASIQVTQKASRTCTRCRVRKQRCDRLLPGCSRCSLKLARCDYSSPPGGQSCHESLVDVGACGWDLSPDGRNELLSSEQGLGIKFSSVLIEANVTLADILDNYTRSIHNWFPIVNIGQLRGHIVNQHKPRTVNTEPPMILLWLAILLVTTQFCGHDEHMRRKRLYTTLQCLCTILQSRDDIGIALVQAKSLIALYECGHGMTRQAYLSLSSIVSMASLLGAELEKELHLRVCLMILDRMIGLAALDDNWPLLCKVSPSWSVGLGDLNSLGTESSSLDPISHRVRSMGKVAFHAGTALNYVKFSKPGDTVDMVSDIMANHAEGILNQLLRHEDSYSGSYCDPTTMALCSLFIMRQKLVRRLNAQPGSKEYLSLQACRRMVWDTCRESLESNKKADVTRLSFVSIFCVFYCLSALVEEPESSPPYNEIDQLVPTLRMFARRWTVADKYLDRIEDGIQNHRSSG